MATKCVLLFVLTCVLNDVFEAFGNYIGKINTIKVSNVTERGKIK
jgi:hypothetical protein